MLLVCFQTKHQHHSVSVVTFNVHHLFPYFITTKRIFTRKWKLFLLLLPMLWVMNILWIFTLKFGVFRQSSKDVKQIDARTCSKIYNPAHDQTHINNKNRQNTRKWHHVLIYVPLRLIHPTMFTLTSFLLICCHFPTHFQTEKKISSCAPHAFACDFRHNCFIGFYCWYI